MKKLLVLSALIVSASALNAATINIENKTNEQLRIQIKYGSSTKSTSVAPRSSTTFNSWIKDITQVMWHNDDTAWQASVEIPGISVGATFDIYEDGQYVVKNCLTCAQQKTQSAKRTSLRGVVTPAK